MLKIVDAEDLLVELQTNSIIHINLIPIVADIVLRQQSGYKIVTKIKYTKNATFLNIYEYDKTSWRYLLNRSVQINT